MGAERILYLNYFYPQAAVKSRRLPVESIAGYNRMKRIVGALASIGMSVDVVSPGICAQCGFTRNVFQGAYHTHENDIDVTVAPAVVVPFVGAMLEVVLFPFWMLLLLCRCRFDGAIIYNYSPSFVLVAALLRVFGIPFVAQVEDIALPAKSDWRAGSQTRPVQQLVLWPCMKIVAGLSAGLMVPSRRFKSFLTKGKPCFIVPGCVADSEWAEYQPVRLRAPIRVLFVGKYETEHGVDLLISALKLLRSRGPVAAHFTFDLCGTDRYPLQLESLSATKNDPIIRLHGLLSDDEYRRLLADAAVALVLQRGKGRYGSLKSPSKAFEFLAAGKLVIATDVGDLAYHSGKRLIMLLQESAEELVRVFEEIVESPQEYEEIALAARNFSLVESSYVGVGKKLRAFLSQVFSAI
jgi:glycosyltransferase involved in cell wall biosynthesis